MDGHLPAFAAVSHIAHTLIDDILDGESSPDVCSLFPVLGVDEVLGVESSC